ncbi:MAG: hypothetical protein ACI956_002129, partial [Nonlabens sp.]
MNNLKLGELANSRMGNRNGGTKTQRLPSKGGPQLT